MKIKNLIFAVAFLAIIIFSFTTCKKSETNSCVDKNLLINKWWYNIIPADTLHGISYTSWYYQSNGRLKSMDQDGTNEQYAGTWVITDACKMLNMVDSTSATPIYTEEILVLTAHELKVKDTWAGFGSYISQYKDTH